MKLQPAMTVVIRREGDRIMRVVETIIFNDMVTGDTALVGYGHSYVVMLC